jgi:uncharacterized protein YfeS
MKINFFLIIFGIISCTNNYQNGQLQIESPYNELLMEDLSKKNAHPTAQKLLKEDFFWSPVEESGPFGNDSGSDTFYFFLEWRKNNPNSNPKDFLLREISNSGFPKFDIYTLDSSIISTFIRKKEELSFAEKEKRKAQIIEGTNKLPKELRDKMGLEHMDEAIEMTSNSMGLTYLTEIDNMIISTGFAQIVLEGEIHKELHELTKIALRRQLKPFLISLWDNYSETRKKQYELMLEKLENLNNI